jgi:hypothetical protein
LVTAVRRTKISPSHLQLLLLTLINIGGGDAVNISYSYIQKGMNQMTKDISESIKDQWQAPDHLLVHFDDKLTPVLTHHSTKQKEKRLPVVVSGNGETKLLGIPSIGKKLTNIYGATVSTTVAGLLNQWNCLENIRGFVFDTTTSNTGYNSGACGTLQRYIGKPQKFQLLFELLQFPLILFNRILCTCVTVDSIVIALFFHF